ncbi:MAG: F0F1 ATP synthase subunit alpha, partial [Gallionella sp.]
MEDKDLQVTIDHAFANLDQVRDAHAQRLDAREIGIVTSLSTGIARVAGLPGVSYEEVVKFPG